MTAAGWVAGAGLLMAVAGVAALAAVHLVVTVEGASMAPAFTHGARVVVRRRRPRRLRVGDVVLLRLWPGGSADRQAAGPRYLVKRVAALPGQPVPAVIPRERLTPPTEVVPPGCLVVLGDNLAVSHDSREAGYFAADQVVGVVVRTMVGP